jgi:hypothetical protein
VEKNKFQWKKPKVKKGKNMWKSLTLILLINAIAIAGESSGGSDYFRPTRAWFRTQDARKAVKVCLDTASDFGVDELELSQMVATAFKTWGDYIKSKKLTVKLGSPVRIASAIEVEKTCSGNEDLKFYFGTSDATVTKAAAKYERPFGFAELMSDTQPQAPWSAGFVWIAPSGSVMPEKSIPNWSVAKASLAALILHEVGHVFGNGHVENTVMTVRLAELLARDTNPATPMASINAYNRIDSVLELIPCLDCQTTYQAARQSTAQASSPGDEILSNAFRRFTGREPLEPLSAIYTGPDYQRMEIVFTDGSGTYRIPVNITTYGGGKPDSARLFNGLSDTYFRSFAAFYIGQMHPASGSPITVVVNYNMDQRKLTIKEAGLEMLPTPLFLSTQ